MEKSDKDTRSKNASGIHPADAFDIVVSDDEQCAYLKIYHVDDVQIDSVLECLRNKKIIFGVDKDKIKTIISAKNSKLTEDELCIAKGITPVEGEDDDIFWGFSERYLRKNCAVVLPDELIATYKHATKGVQGKNIYGRTLTVSNGEKRRLHIGGGVRTVKTENAEEYWSTNLGIINTEKDHSEFIEVNSLLQVSADDMKAVMDIYAESATEKIIDYEIIANELGNHGVVCGIDQDAIEAALKKSASLSSDKPVDCVKQVVVASGIEAEPAKDASLIISRKENVVGAELSNGYIDFHELGYPWNVSIGDRVGYLLSSRPGVEGTTIKGAAIKVGKPKEINCKFDGLHKDDKGRLIADENGALIINGNNLSVIDLLTVNNDVALKTGNIHSEIPVHVKGHVKAGFSLESDKDVIIDRNVEDAEVRAGSDIVIKGGIRGMKSKIYSPSDVRVGFVENASIYVNGKLIVGGSIINSVVASNDTVIVGDKKTQHSMVVGGELTAKNYLEASELGSDAYSKTIVKLGIAQEERRQIILIDKEVNEIQEKLEKVTQIEYRHKLTPVADTKDVLFKLAITRKALLNQIDDLESKRLEVLTRLKETCNAKAVVKRCVYPGVVLFINDRFYKVRNKLGAGSFIFDKDNDRVVFLPE